MELKIALKVDDKDNVATIFANGITDGTAKHFCRKIEVDNALQIVLGDLSFFLRNESRVQLNKIQSPSKA